MAYPVGPARGPSPKALKAFEKWGRNTLATMDIWKNMVRDAYGRDAHAKGVADFLGVPYEAVRDLDPYKHWREFAAKVDEYVPIREAGVKAAIDKKLWLKKYYLKMAGFLPSV